MHILDSFWFPVERQFRKITASSRELATEWLDYMIPQTPDSMIRGLSILSLP